MNKIFTYSNAPLILTTLLITIILIIIFLVINKTRKAKEMEERFFEQLKFASDTELYNIKEDKKIGFIAKKFNIWGERLKEAKMVSPYKSNAKISLGLIFISLTVYLLLSLIFQNLGLGLVPAFLIFIAIQIIAKNKIKKRKKLLEEQILPFLSSLKSNIQANSTPERALIDAINMTTEPLYDELKVALNYSQTANFNVALEKLRYETSSKDLRFLCSCIELSSKLGANLENQIETIEELVKERKDLQRKLDGAIRENKPLLYVSSLALPGLFIYMYLFDENSRNFWFKIPFSWIIFFSVVFIFGGCIWASNKIIEKLDEYK